MGKMTKLKKGLGGVKKGAGKDKKRGAGKRGEKMVFYPLKFPAGILYPPHSQNSRSEALRWIFRGVKYIFQGITWSGPPDKIFGGQKVF